MAKDLLLEIGAEELPAGFIKPALDLIAERLKKNLTAARLGCGEVKTLGTPRRLAFIISNIDDRQTDAEVEVKGPQAKAAYNDKGEPTGALLGFLKSQSIDIKDVKIIQSGKAEYVSATKKIIGQDTISILPGIILSAISGDIFPKSMRWSDHDMTFARPVHWVLAKYGTDTVPFDFGHVKSSSYTYGHRFMSDGKPIEIADAIADIYIEKLRSAFVIVDPEERKAIIQKELDAAAKAVNGHVLADDGRLIDEVTYLIEFPTVLCGGFDKEFLELPIQITVQTMREHQRYFSVMGAGGHSLRENLLPYFLTVANTQAADMAVIQKGNERVLRARLNDARFYYEQDIKVNLVDRVEALKGVIFQAKLGTSYEKVERFTSLALYIGAAVGFSHPMTEGEAPFDYLTDAFNPANLNSGADAKLRNKYIIGRSAVLAKADLTSGMVGEFPKLQGIMGGIYAEKSGEVYDVTRAIAEHYMPLSSGGALPEHYAGAIISIADKLDTICGCFSVGLTPTGAQDQYALRRQAIGIIAIILDKGFDIRLDELVDRSIKLLGRKPTKDVAETKTAVLEFFKERLRNLLITDELPFDAIDAVLAVDWYNIVDAVKRIKALVEFKKLPECEQLTVAFKRVSNILKCASVDGTPDEKLFKMLEEKALYEKGAKLLAEIEDNRKYLNHYEKEFKLLASIKDSIDAFFDRVLVMDEDEKVKENRLRLLNMIRGLYINVADLSRLQSEVSATLPCSWEIK